MIPFKQSFRFRIIALTILVSGTVLLAFGLASRYSFYRIKIATVDQNLRTLPFREFPHPGDERSWELILDGIERIANRMFQGEIHILSYGEGGEAYYKSEYWPNGITAGDMPTVNGDLKPLDVNDPAFLPYREGERRRRREGFPGDPPAIDLPEEERPRDVLPLTSEEALRLREAANRAVELFRRGERGPPRIRQVPDFLSIKSADGLVRFGIFKYEGYNVALGVELRSVAREMEHVRDAFFLSLPLALAILTLGAWVIASRAIKPVRKLTQAASGLSVKNLDERIALADEDREFFDLINVFNEMLERLQRSFLQATRFSADAAHELKTPLTILQGHLESALQEAPDDSDQQRRLGMLLDETQRLRGITRRLLLLAQADAGQLRVSGEVTRVDALIKEVVEDFEMQAPDCDFKTALDLEVEATVDRSLLTQILQNLLSNAVKYNAEKGPWVEVILEQTDDRFQVDVSNGGQGIPAEQQARLFDRFGRVDSVRNREVDGFGLGLSLSREFARAQGGELELVESDGNRTRFRLTLPRAI